MKFKLTHKPGSYLGELFCDYGQGYKKLFDTLDPLIVQSGGYTIELYASPDWAAKSNTELPYYVPLICGKNADTHFYEFHPGNWLKDSKACVLVGDVNEDDKTQPALRNSSTTFIKLLCLLFSDKAQYETKNWELIIE